MKKILITCMLCCLSLSFYAQVQQQSQILSLAKDYHNYMFRNQPTKDVLKEIRSIVDADMAPVADFVAQTITPKNSILHSKYLKRPDDATLKSLYIIRKVSQNLGEKEPVDNKQLIDSLTNANVPIYELVDNYYEMIFTSDGNKNQPFNLSKMDFKMSDYGLKDDTEKGIFFLKCMNYCGKTRRNVHFAG